MDNIHQLIKMALSEDIGTGDITSLACVPKELNATAKMIAKEDMVVCGVNLAREVFYQAGRLLRTKGNIQVVIKKKDGSFARKGDVLMEITTKARLLITAERTALNFIQRLCGIATLTDRYVKKIRGTKAKILDTRKTTPGWRVLEKYAVKCGGGMNHRIGLFDMFLIKNNHVDVCGAVEEAVMLAKSPLSRLCKGGKKKIPIEAEARDIEEMCEAISSGADIIMLDNFSPAEIKRALKLAGQVSKICGSKPYFEASGGITFENIREYARTGVDFISVGALTHSAKASDICLRIS